MGVVAVPHHRDELLRIEVPPQVADQLPPPLGGEVRHHHAVHQRRRGLVAHADTRRAGQGDRAVGRRIPHGDAELLGHRVGDVLVALHPVHDVAAEPDDDLALGFHGQERIERHQAFDFHPVRVHRAGDLLHGFVRHAAEPALHLEDDVHHAGPVVPEPPADLVRELRHVLFQFRLPGINGRPARPACDLPAGSYTGYGLTTAPEWCRPPCAVNGYYCRKLDRVG